MNMYTNPYSAAQDEYLRAHYTTAAKADVMAQFPGRRWPVIQNHAYFLGCVGRFRPERNISRLWPPAADAYLRAHYPTGGGAAVAAHLGVTSVQAGSRAAHLGILHIKPPKAAKAPRPDPGPRAPRKAAAPRAPRVVAAKPDKALPVKLRPLLPNLNAAKKARKKAERAVAAMGLGDAIARHKTLRYGEREHTAFLENGLSGWLRWKEEQAKAAQAQQAA